MKLTALIALSIALTAQSLAATASPQSVFVIAINTDSQVIGLCSSSLEIERKVREEFTKKHAYVLTSKATGSDFTFIVLNDSTAGNIEEFALVVKSSDFRADETLTELREKAIWSSAGKQPSKKFLAGAVATAGWSAIIANKSASRELVKQFHKEFHN